jgi:hypothetical protein
MWYKSAAPEVIYEHFASLCRAYGYADGTDEMRGCVERESQSQRQERAARMAENEHQQESNRQHCVTRMIGNFATTDCY